MKEIRDLTATRSTPISSGLCTAKEDSPGNSSARRGQPSGTSLGEAPSTLARDLERFNEAVRRLWGTRSTEAAPEQRNAAQATLDGPRALSAYLDCVDTIYEDIAALPTGTLDEMMRRGGPLDPAHVNYRMSAAADRLASALQ